MNKNERKGNETNQKQPKQTVKKIQQQQNLWSKRLKKIGIQSCGSMKKSHHKWARETSKRKNPESSPTLSPKQRQKNEQKNFKKTY